MTDIKPISLLRPINWWSLLRHFTYYSDVYSCKIFFKSVRELQSYGQDKRLLTNGQNSKFNEVL